MCSEGEVLDASEPANRGVEIRASPPLRTAPERREMPPTRCPGRFPASLSSGSTEGEFARPRPYTFPQESPRRVKLLRGCFSPLSFLPLSRIRAGSLSSPSPPPRTPLRPGRGDHPTQKHGFGRGEAGQAAVYFATSARPSPRYARSLSEPPSPHGGSLLCPGTPPTAPRRMAPQESRHRHSGTLRRRLRPGATTTRASLPERRLENLA